MLSPGTKLGGYEILSAIGAGGMGEVYRARDTNLGRDVAVKVLPDAFARDAERMARFQREARVLGSLNHPNIASIYGLEDSGSTRALVMEMVEGPTLADRVKTGPIPIDDALLIARQICDALEYAHERGIVHRDLKPANVKVTTDDAVKVLDFGLAKAIEKKAAREDSLEVSGLLHRMENLLDGDSATEMAKSPTLSEMATQAGILLGTAAYMPPEQAKAKPVDRRADIWAFGCVLYEILTGRMAFQAETVAETLAAVITKEPNWPLLPATTPIRVRMLLQRCLRKDPKQRLRDIGDARISLDEVLSSEPEPSFAPREEPVGLTRFEIPVPEKTALAANGVFAISPDGRRLAFAATGSDRLTRLWIRSLDSLKAHPLAGSESLHCPPFFWSPDSRYIAFDAGGKLRKISVSGGPAETLCDVPSQAVGGSWNRDGVIIFGQYPGGLMRVPASGGSASPLTALDESRGDIFHDFPSFLPDGRHFIYVRRSTVTGNTGIYCGSLDAKPETQDSKRILAADSAAAYVPFPGVDQGHLLFVQDGSLMAQSFDVRRLQLAGERTTVVDHVGIFRSWGFFSASTNGALVYRTGAASEQLTWFDREGKALGTIASPGYADTLSLSPDGSLAAVSRSDPTTGVPAALWLLDLSRGTSTRFTFGASFALAPIWSPDGGQIIFASNRSGVFDLYRKLASGVKHEELLLKSSESKYPTSWSRDGRFLLYQTSDSKTATVGLWVVPLEGNEEPFPFLRTEFTNEDGQFSPDGRWVAYSSDESGRSEIYVRTFSPDSAVASDADAKWLISTGGGFEPRWRGDGKELYYRAPDWKLMAVEIATSPEFRPGVPKALFQTTPRFLLPPYHGWDLTPDGRRFLFPAPAEQGETPFTVVLNWQAALEK